jgi:hypothetical protein
MKLIQFRGVYPISAERSCEYSCTLSQYKVKTTHTITSSHSLETHVFRGVSKLFQVKCELDCNKPLLLSSRIFLVPFMVSLLL